MAIWLRWLLMRCWYLVLGGVAGGRGFEPQGLLPMTISEEESNLFCAFHLLNCDEGQGQ
jgi:hypothetical protein